ncbi:MAG: Cytochrome c-type biogenesis protein CcmG/DsbE, thiol:disulfide oxidoreductase [uncultured Acidimicrobiales bacterium]|uniref:Cytochrome c-type biogenesis protein CcmG/DsbE, thiol:disulfide oxidoreductase n=1 Tax=uncultured Acidimicrobiales bacterium TaxID=310071 RepID=A0A6J4H0V7_9ACTN|nr:MAG: Cytochrome c-type biogenesis protein CcmG/DsbE, thiol:disulfide oxidoreductase [uncultured Acidimicrobiales bacterium]
MTTLTAAAAESGPNGAGGGPSETPGRRASHTARWIAVVVGIVVLGFLAVVATRESGLNTVAPSPLTGKLAPEVTGSGLDGETVRLAQMRGSYVVVNFFASWCVPCKEEHDDLVAFSQRYEQSNEARIVAVIYSDTPENARGFFAKNGGSWPVITDPNGKVALDFGVRGVPESFLIDPDGVVLARITGSVDLNGLEALVEQARVMRS